MTDSIQITNFPDTHHFSRIEHDTFCEYSLCNDCTKMKKSHKIVQWINDHPGKGVEFSERVGNN